MCTFKLLKTCRSSSGEFDLNKNVAEILLQHGSSQPHTNLKTREAITLLSCPPYSPDLAASGFHLIGALEGAICEKRLGCDDEFIEEVKKWLQVQKLTWYKKETDGLVSC